MKLLQEFKADFEYEVVKEEVQDPTKPNRLFLKGIIQRANALNQNGRIYPRDILFKEIENYKKLVQERRALGELNHADSPIVDLERVSHVITDIWTEGDVVMGKIEILPTPTGLIAKTLVENNIKIGISSRALGSVRNTSTADIVQDDLHLICWDLVSDPSTNGAFMMKEAREIDPSVIKKIFNKNERVDRLCNELLQFETAIKKESK